MIGGQLTNQGWRLEVVDTSRYHYKKDLYAFEIRHMDPYVFVTVPLPGTDSRYRTRLDSQSKAEEYLSMHSNYLKKIIETNLDYITAC